MMQSSIKTNILVKLIELLLELQLTDIRFLFWRIYQFQNMDTLHETECLDL